VRVLKRKVQGTVDVENLEVVDLLMISDRIQVHHEKPDARSRLASCERYT
jgi:hypothetical protein